MLIKTLSGIVNMANVEEIRPEYKTQSPSNMHCYVIAETVSGKERILCTCPSREHADHLIEQLWLYLKMDGHANIEVIANTHNIPVMG